MDWKIGDKALSVGDYSKDMLTCLRFGHKIIFPEMLIEYEVERVANCVNGSVALILKEIGEQTLLVDGRIQYCGFDALLFVKPLSKSELSELVEHNINKVTV